MKDRIDAYIDGLEQLPPAPVLMVKLIAAFRQPDRDVDEIVSVMSHDPSLTAEVLKRCNRSILGDGEPVVEVAEAVFRLGFYEVYQMAIALFGRQSMSLAKVKNGINVEELWCHSAIAAVAAGTLSKELGESDGVAFTAGLLHDIGKIVFASAEGGKYADLTREAQLTGSPLWGLEKNAFGFGHAEVGARLLARWGLPVEVSAPVGSHHNTCAAGPFQRTAAIVNISNLMAHSFEEGQFPQPHELEAAGDVLEFLNLQGEDMPALMEQAQNDLKRLHDLVPASVANVTLAHRNS